MDYKKIIYQAYTNPINRKNIKDYFIRQYKNAEKEYYSINEFFDGCLHVIQIFEERFEFQFQERMGQLAIALDIAEDENNLDRIKNITEQMENLDKDQFSEFKLNYTVTMLIKKEIEEAKLSLLPKKKTKPTNVEPLNFELNQSEVIYIFDILQKAGFLNEPKFHEGSYYRKLEKYFTANKTPIKDAEQKRYKYLEKPLSNSENIKSQLIEAIKKM